MQFHFNASTNRGQRRLIQDSSRSCRSLASQFCVSPATVHTWEQREDQADCFCRPLTIHYALCDQEKVMVCGCGKAARCPWATRWAPLRLCCLIFAVPVCTVFWCDMAVTAWLKKSSKRPDSPAPSRIMALATCISIAFICPNSTGRSIVAL